MSLYVMPSRTVPELFGPTPQGEEPSAPRPASFFRLSGCLPSCRWWDTPWTWDWTRCDRGTEQCHMPTADVLAWALGQRAATVL
jgi:7-carboxy-7-deazaguanine synthase